MDPSTQKKIDSRIAHVQTMLPKLNLFYERKEKEWTEKQLFLNAQATEQIDSLKASHLKELEKLGTDVMRKLADNITRLSLNCEFCIPEKYLKVQEVLLRQGREMQSVIKHNMQTNRAQNQAREAFLLKREKFLARHEELKTMTTTHEQRRRERKLELRERAKTIISSELEEQDQILNLVSRIQRAEITYKLNQEQKLIMVQEALCKEQASLPSHISPSFIQSLAESKESRHSLKERMIGSFIHRRTQIWGELMSRLRKYEDERCERSRLSIASNTSRVQANATVRAEERLNNEILRQARHFEVRFTYFRFG
jgi:hypothetical protein